VSIILEQLTKRYGGHPVVNNLSLEIGDGEFFVLLGPSGSGKTTVLSLIAGLLQVDRGRVLLHGRDVTHLPTQQRRVGFVFQNYALFQYMSVSENIGFGLKIRKASLAARRQRVEALLDLVGLSGLGGRMPRQLSGGEQQRVALARALAHHPDVLLLDEPLSALDAKIRLDLRRSLRDIQRKLGIATILVTHDQEEAFELADRMGVMSFGRLLEVGKPAELYQKPKTEFVATFLGTANLLLGKTSGVEVQLGPTRFAVPGNTPATEGQRVQVLFRPEDVTLCADPQELGCQALGLAEVEDVSYGGAYERLRLRLPPIPGVRPIAPPVSFGNRSILVDVTRSPEQAARLPLGAGDRAWLGVRRFHILSHPGMKFLIPVEKTALSNAAVLLAIKIARLAYARVTLLGSGPDQVGIQAHLEETRKSLSTGVAALELTYEPDNLARAMARLMDAQPFDLVVMGFRPILDIPLAEAVLRTSDHHLLLVPGEKPVPGRVLICVAGGEPGKEDILFAGRFIRHLGSQATLLSILPAGQQENMDLQKRVSRFLENGIKTLALLGVPAESRLIFGPVAETILSELHSGAFDLLVLGAPLTRGGGQITLTGVLGHVLTHAVDCPILIVQSHHIAKKHVNPSIGT